MILRAPLVVAAAFALTHGAEAQMANMQHASVTTTQLSSSKRGYTTYQVGVAFDSGMVEDVYALFGESGDGMVIPPAFQVDAPFGTDVGPVSLCLLRLHPRLLLCRAFALTHTELDSWGLQTNPAFFPLMADAEFDSFLTIGMDGPALTPGALSTIGIDFASWNERTGINAEDGAVRRPPSSSNVRDVDCAAYIVTRLHVYTSLVRCFLWTRRMAQPPSP